MLRGTHVVAGILWTGKEPVEIGRHRAKIRRRSTTGVAQNKRRGERVDRDVAVGEILPRRKIISGYGNVQLWSALPLQELGQQRHNYNAEKPDDPEKIDEPRFVEGFQLSQKIIHHIRIVVLPARIRTLTSICGGGKRARDGAL